MDKRNRIPLCDSQSFIEDQKAASSEPAQTPDNTCPTSEKPFQTSTVCESTDSSLSIVDYLRDDSDDLSELQLLKQRAENGDADAQFTLGRRFAIGQGAPLDHSEAVRWYIKAASQGHDGAQINLGVCYAMGKGIAQNYEEAAKWFYRAARQGDPDAHFNLGSLYLHGKGIPLNYDKAARCLSFAAQHGNKLAKDYLSRIPARYRRKYATARNGGKPSCLLRNLLTALSSFAARRNSRR